MYCLLMCLKRAELFVGMYSDCPEVCVLATHLAYTKFYTYFLTTNLTTMLPTVLSEILHNRRPNTELSINYKMRI
jgi:hypothetical protein